MLPATTNDFLTHEPIFNMPCWRHLRTRDKCVALSVLLTTEILKCENGIRPVLGNDKSVLLSVRWLVCYWWRSRSLILFYRYVPVLTESKEHYWHRVSCSTSITFTREKVMKLNLHISWNYPLPAKLEISEDAIKFTSTSSRPYLIRFCAPESKFSS